MAVVKLQSIIALIVRTEMEKSPVIVYPYEVAVLKAITNDQNQHLKIEVTDAVSPLGLTELNLQDEYSRLLTHYNMASHDGVNPVNLVYEDFEAFEVAAMKLVEKAARGKKTEA